MSTITTQWKNAAVDGAVDTGDVLDTKINDLAVATRERAQNGGQYWPDSSSSPLSGMNYPSPDAKDPDEWVVYGASAGAPDTATKLIKATGTAIELNKNTTVTGNFTVTGTPSDNLRDYWVFPMHLGNTGRTEAAVYIPFACTLVAFTLIDDPGELSNRAGTLTLEKATPTWSLDKFSSFPTTSAVDTLVKTTSESGMRKTGLSHALAAGDLLYLAINTSSYSFNVTLVFKRS